MWIYQLTTWRLEGLRGGFALWSCASWKKTAESMIKSIMRPRKMRTNTRLVRSAQIKYMKQSTAMKTMKNPNVALYPSVVMPISGVFELRLWDPGEYAA
jgi:hypothetical protein